MVQIYLTWVEKDAHITFAEFSRDRWGEGWAVARKTPRNLERYERCITRREYEQGRKEWAERRRLAREHLGLPVGEIE